MHLYDHKLSYFSVPKCANTSVKNMLFEIEHGRKYKALQPDGSRVGIHGYAINKPFRAQPHDKIKDHRRFTVLRSPEERVLSFYCDKFHSPELENRKAGQKIIELGLPIKPTLGEFVENIEAYRDANPFMYAHLGPLSNFLGTDPAYFDRILRVADLDELPDYLSEIFGKTTKVLHMRRRAHNGEGSQLSAAHVAKIRDVYAEDYEIFGRFF